MPGLKIVLIASFVILGVLLVLVMFTPMVGGTESTTVSRESTLQTEDEWIIQWDIINREGEDITYIFNWSSGEKNYTVKAPVLDGRKYTHIYHAYPETVKEGKVHLTICKEGESTPFEEVTYYIDFD